MLRVMLYYPRPVRPSGHVRRCVEDPPVYKSVHMSYIRSVFDVRSGVSERNRTLIYLRYRPVCTKASRPNPMERHRMPILASAFLVYYISHSSLSLLKPCIHLIPDVV